MSGYIKEQILSKEELKEAMAVYESLPMNYYHQQYNLFDVERRDVPAPIHFGFFEKLQHYSKMKYNKGAYFLRYVPGSFTRMHTDNNSDLTVVTLLQTENLKGGYSLVTGEYKRKERPSDRLASRHAYEENTPPYGKEIVMDVIDIEDGESLVYGPELNHGVSKVYEGHRIVLITWFKKTKVN